MVNQQLNVHQVTNILPGDIFSHYDTGKFYMHLDQQIVPPKLHVLKLKQYPICKQIHQQHSVQFFKSISKYQNLKLFFTAFQIPEKKKKKKKKTNSE